MWSFLFPNTLVGWSDEVNDGDAFNVGLLEQIEKEEKKCWILFVDYGRKKKGKDW